ncbi:hypothetical protein [Streptomyces acidiscabies]|uniref:EH domain-containing protein n=1 Tax=Streptomyces acidiscabies TaxID=42234 RepID=A0A0L0K7J8_9ACTN|nr:hypothetical protein [Streptomyces acidiscabies]KND33851.1 hypothetical protein IQ63_18245 [Streptomyces acidiscabies]
MTGRRDRTASVTCSSNCPMPARSRDVAALRRFAEAHAAAHARAATVRPDAACGCRQLKCAAHEGTRASCAGAVVLVLRHDPAVGQVWTLMEVCSACAPLMSHTRVVARAAPRARQGGDAPPVPAPVPSVEAPPAQSSRAVPGGFSAPAREGGELAEAVPRRRRGRTGGEGRRD